MKYKFFNISLLILTLFHLSCKDSDNRKYLSFVNCRIIDGTGNEVIEDGTIITSNGIIIKTGKNIKPPRNSKIIDIDGKSILPGLVDSHAHFWLNGIPQPEVLSNLYLASGVTTVFSCGEVVPDSLFNFINDVDKGEKKGPRIFTVGPYFQKDFPMGTEEAVNTVEEAVSLYNKYKGKIDGIKIYDRITQDQFIALSEKASEDSLLLVAHLYNKQLLADFAIKHGLNIISHGIWCIPDVRPEIEGSPFCQMSHINLESDTLNNLIEQIVQNQVAVCPTITALEATDTSFHGVLPDWRIFLDDSSKLVYDHSYKSRNQDCFKIIMDLQYEFVRMLYDAGAVITVGSDAVFAELLAGFTLHREMQHYSNIGIPNLEIIKMATFQNAWSIRKDDVLGSIEPGKYADFIIVDGKPDLIISDISKISKVIKAGEIYNPQEFRDKSIGKINLIRPDKN